jgi:tetratricopeptide (TPR) repeat protein
VAELLRVAAVVSSPEQAVQEGLPEQPELMLQLAQEDFRLPEDEPLREALLDRAEGLLSRVPLPSGERAQLESRLLVMRDRKEEALRKQQEAVEARPDMVAWRFQLAQLLREQGEVELAWEHARTLVRIDPDNRRYDRLFRELVRARLK